MDFQKKKKVHRFRRFFIAVGAVAALAACVMLIIANVNMWRKKQQLNTRIELLKTQIASLQQENKELDTSVANAGDNAYIEKVAREQLNLQKPGETVVSFVKTQQEEKPPQVHLGILGVWLGWLSGWIK